VLRLDVMTPGGGTMMRMERHDMLAITTLIDSDPALGLRRLADELWLLRDRMNPADTVDYRCGDLEFSVGRHEVPALAMLFSAWDADPEVSATALERARGYLSTGRLCRR
jgi:hypothetical protein